MPTLTPLELLKFQLLAEGISIDEQAQAAWLERYGGPLTLAEYATTSGLSLVLPGDLYVNAPLCEPGDGVLRLRFGDDTFFVSANSRDVAVDVIPVPAFHTRSQVDRADGRSYPYTSYGVTHTDRCRVSPIEGCAWRCHFCDLPYEFKYRKKHEENLLNVILAAKDDDLAPARHVLVSGGTPRKGKPGHSDEEWIDGVYAYLAEHSPMPVDVMMPPRRDFGYPDWLRSIGVSMVSINLEISDPDRAHEIARAKSKYGRERTLAYIERAVESFGIGFVQSLVVFGSAIEPLEETLRAVSDLVDRGCIPVLSAFRPHASTPLGGAPAATLDEMLYVYGRALDICERAGNGIRPGPRCIPCHHNTVTLPDGSDFYVGLEGDLTRR
jgi:hypothetical protein